MDSNLAARQQRVARARSMARPSPARLDDAHRSSTRPASTTRTRPCATLLRIRVSCVDEPTTTTFTMDGDAVARTRTWTLALAPSSRVPTLHASSARSSQLPRLALAVAI